MTREAKSATHEKMREILMSLNAEERQLLSKVLQIQRQHIHQLKPKITEDLLAAVREVIK